MAKHGPWPAVVHDMGLAVVSSNSSMYSVRRRCIIIVMVGTNLLRAVHLCYSYHRGIEQEAGGEYS